jgi:hypothetical protein
MPRRPSPDELRRRLLAAARQLLDADDVTLVLVAGPVEVVSALPPPPTPSAPPLPARLPPVGVAILGALGDRPASAKALARRSGRRLNTYFYEALRSLVDSGHVRRTSAGYSRPG